MQESVTKRPQNGGGTAIYVLGSLAEGVFGMAFTMILVRLISQEDFGAWRQFMVLSNIAMNVAVFGLPRSLMYFFSTASPVQQGAIARRTMWLTLAVAAVTMVVFYFGLPVAAERFDSPGLAEYAFLFSTFLGLSFPTMIAFALFITANRRGLSAGVRVALGMIKLAVLMALVWWDASLKSFLIVMNVFAIAQFFVLLALYLKVAGPTVGPMWQNFRAQWKYSTNVAVQTIAGQIGAETDKLLVSSAYNPARFGSYSVGARELPLVPMIPYSITDSISPDLSRLSVAGKFDEFRELWHRWIKRAAVLMYPIFALVLFQHKEIVTILYTADYIEGAIPMLIIGCLIPLRMTSFYQVMLSLNGSRVIMYGSIAMLIIIASLSWIFLHTFGLWGPALAILIAEYTVNSAVLISISKRTGLTFAKVLPWGFLFRLLVIAVTSGALALPVLGLVSEFSLFWRFMVYGLTMMILYGAIVLSLSMVSSDDLALVRAKFRR